MKWIYSFLLFILSIFVDAQSMHCLDNRYSEDTLFSSGQIIAIQNVSYGNANHFLTGTATNLLADVYYPDPNVDPLPERPLVIMIHGGAFLAGDKSELTDIARGFAQRGFVVMNINYRLGWGCDLEGAAACLFCGGLISNFKKATYCAVQDARAAFRYAESQEAQWKVDSDWVFIAGESAGAITALHTTYWQQDEADAFLGDSFSSTNGDLDHSGNSLTGTYSIKAVVNHCGAITDLNAIDESEMLPMISYHDQGDCIVPYQSGQVITCPCNFNLYYVSGSLSIHNYLLQHDQCSVLYAPTTVAQHCSTPHYIITAHAACFLKQVMCDICGNGFSTDVYQNSDCSNLGTAVPVIAGCTYPQAANYNALATFDNGTCTFEACLCPGDLDGNGLINVDDLAAFLAIYGSTCP